MSFMRCPQRCEPPYDATGTASNAPHCRPAPKAAKTMGPVTLAASDHCAAAISSEADEVLPKEAMFVKKRSSGHLEFFGDLGEQVAVGLVHEEDLDIVRCDVVLRRADRR